MMSNFNEALAVFRNQERSNSRVLIRLKGTQSNSWGLGAKVILQMAFGDVDGDRREDFYLCGAAGYSGMLFVRQKNGAFARRPQQSFENDSAYEDMGALFFDADGDGDLDLYVVSGGVECEPGSELLQDRLFHFRQ